MEILGIVDVSTTWIVVVLMLLLIYLYGRKRNQVFKDLGIPGPEPIIYIGNLHQIIYWGVDFDRPRPKVEGFLFGGTPMLTIEDTDIMREILIKQFDKFTDRLTLDLDDYPINRGLFFEKGTAWQRLRHITSPTFSGAKLRLMCEKINKCAEALTDNFLSAANSESDILVKEYFGGFTMDVIASTAFGVDTDSQKELNNKIITEAKKVFSEAGIFRLTALLTLLFPEFTPIFKRLGFSVFPKKSVAFTTDVITEMINQRKEEKLDEGKRVDFLQLLIDAEDDGTFDDVTDSRQQGTSKKKSLTSDEILGQALLFFVAGYETTANTLHYAAYLLATNPDVQAKLLEEIDTVLGDSQPNYDNIGELSYLDHVIMETLRLFPVVPALSRVALETVEFKNITIPKGMAVTIPSMSLHRNPEVYSEPHKFQPERWQEKSEIDSMNYLPFGHGPRHCIGMRLAKLEMRFALATVLKKIRFVPGKETPMTLEGKDLKLTATFSTKKPIKLKVEAR